MGLTEVGAPRGGARACPCIARCWSVCLHMILHMMLSHAASRFLNSLYNTHLHLIFLFGCEEQIRLWCFVWHLVLEFQIGCQYWAIIFLLCCKCPSRHSCAGFVFFAKVILGLVSILTYIYLSFLEFQWCSYGGQEGGLALNPPPPISSQHFKICIF